ncbi:unnamed protein product [Medioppia subpectinata]|uniref:Steroid dehydrogenase n=1 Tax=Medioppia subpectinata TaxID=1979941 RepID=A0A7R9KYT1_9ACAR|nr:unnamed protein product [Medioppia subpectinata]CAG2112156.1 unnamed protein product [Medioppia subpectinata]
MVSKFLSNVWDLCTKRSIKWRGNGNTWVVITGSTDGIGLEYAKQFARKGYNLLLMSRSAAKLAKVSHEIQSTHPKCRIRGLAVDFSRADIYDTIAEELTCLGEIDVLVNNVGITYPNECPEYFTQIPNLKQFIDTMINVNVISCTRLMALVIPGMESRARGVIINVSSFTANFPTPLLALYSATKVYIDYLSRALNEEYKSKGIIIQSVLPFYVSTKMTKYIKTSLFIPTPEQYVRSALKTVAVESQTAGTFGHKLITNGQRICSYLFGVNFLIKLALIHFQEIRRRFYANEDMTQFNYKLFLPTKP